jgi:hypothetical protein
MAGDVNNQNPNQPVAYDADGNPLYAAPQYPRDDEVPQQDSQTGAKSHVTSVPDHHEGQNYNPKIRVQYANEPRVVHAKREFEPEELQISDELKLKHQRSVEMFPNLNLSAAEYVIVSIKRHPIGLLLPMMVTIVTTMILIGFVIGYPMIAESIGGDNASSATTIAAILIGMVILVGLGGYIAVWVYLRNTFYLTNESVIQEIQYSLFSRHEQTVSLGSIEDASFIQRGIIQTLLDYGTIRLSTEGEETTYQFFFVSNPKKQVAILNNAVESFKNGRPVTGNLHSDDN